MESLIQTEISRPPVSSKDQLSRFDFIRKLAFGFVAVIAILFYCVPASAIEKWIQPPDLSTNGIDIRMDRSDGFPRLLADDFLCTTTGPITGVQFWGSWNNDNIGYLIAIRLSILEYITATPFSPLPLVA